MSRNRCLVGPLPRERTGLLSKRDRLFMRGLVRAVLAEGLDSDSQVRAFRAAEQQRVLLDLYEIESVLEAPRLSCLATAIRALHGYIRDHATLPSDVE